ncbi:MAG: CRTAC1 family protein [Bryobacterales bacterium]|nr:CRTAC1 family protein [Bryobacterales bacterium]
MTRRELGMWMLQGVASRNVRPQPRGKASGLPFHAKFTDVAARAGLTAPSIYGEVSKKDYILEAVGCGVAFFDYDNDGWLDILVLSGTRFGEAPASATNRLYKNNRDGTFTDVTKQAGLMKTGWATGVTIADYNNDGWDDIFLTYWGRNVLYRNNGDGTFTDVTKEAGLLAPAAEYFTGCTFFDYNRDGHLDLFVSTYVEFDPARVPKPGQNPNCTWKGVPVNCGPRGLGRGRCLLYRNDGKGRFTEVTREAGLAAARGYHFTAVAADFDNDGWPDVYVACDSTRSLYFRNLRNGRFAEEALERGVAVNEDGMEQAGMGVGVGDYARNGALAIFKTHFADDTSILYHNDGKGNFEDVTIRSGLGVETRYVGWGAGIVDLDNNGWPDLFLVTGSVYPELDGKIAGYPYKTPRVIFRNLGNGRFEELLDGAGEAIGTAHSSRGCAFGDFDNDGDMDVVVWNMNEPPSLLRNDCDPKQNWVKLFLTGVKSNRSAIGARATVRYGNRVQVQEVLAQSSFLSVNDRRLHFGLGSDTRAEVEIRWPAGQVETIGVVEINKLISIHEGKGVVKSVPLRNSGTV